MKAKKKRMLHCQAREVIFNVFKFMKQEKDTNKLSIPLDSLMNRVIAATGIVSMSTLQRIIKEGRNKPEGSKFTSPRKTINKPGPKSSVEQLDAKMIRDVIYNFINVHKISPTMESLYRAVKDEGFILLGKLGSFRKIIRKLGFRYKRTEDNKRILTEKYDVRAKRTNFLRKIRKYKEEGRYIVYMDETYINSSNTIPKSWSDGSANCLNSPLPKGRRLIVAHAGGREGFIPNGKLIFKYGQRSGDFHGDMNHNNYMKWLKEKIIPNLPSNCVLVINNNPYHNVPIEPNPSSNWKTSDMQTWLKAKNIDFSTFDTKPELFEKIQLHKPSEPLTAVDMLLAQHGHSVLRVPLYHPELNPIENILGIVKNKVAACNTNLKMEDVQMLVEEQLERITPEIWGNVFKHVEKVEEEYYSREFVMDENDDTQEVLIRRGDESDESDFSSTTDEENYDD